MDVAVVTEEFTVAAAAEHDVWIEFAKEFGSGFGEDTGEIGFMPSRVSPKVGKVIIADLVFAENTFLLDQQIIASYRGYQQGGGFTGNASSTRSSTKSNSSRGL